MNPLEWMTSALVSPTVVQVAAWTLLHFLWQGALVGGGLAIALNLLRRHDARLRYATALAALATMAVLPVVTATLIASRSDVALQAHTAPRLALPTAPVAVAARNTGTVESMGSTPPAARQSTLEAALPWLVVAWLLGVTGLSLAHCGGWRRVRRLRKQGIQRIDDHWQQRCQSLAIRLGIRRTVQLLESARVGVPTVIGWLRPVILVPASALTGLSRQQLESILAHELAHVRRHDVLVNGLQVAVETLLFYHPAMWWTSQQVRTLREHCCDDLAVEVCGDRMTYARALAELEDLRFAAPVFALGADGGPLLQRIRRLVGAGEELRAPSWLNGALAVTALATTAMLFAFAGQPGIAQEAANEATVGSPHSVPAMLLAQLPDPAGPSDAEERSPRSPRSNPSASALPAAARPASAQIPIDQLIEMKIHGLDDLMDDLEGSPYADLPVAQLIEMAKFGIDGELITSLADAGYANLEASELTEMAMFGVDGELIEELAATGITTQSAAELVELAKFGVDGELVEELSAAGYVTGSPEELVELAKFGVDGELIEELNAAGFADQTAEQLIELAKFGVDGDLIEELSVAGYTAGSPTELIELAKFGVDGELIEELSLIGHRNLGTEQLTDLAKFGADRDFIRNLREAGIDNLALDDLMRMARHGLDAEFITKMRHHATADP